MKRAISFIIIFCLIFSLCACNSSETEDHKQQVEDVKEELSKNAEKNSKADVGEYVLADEADFEWEELEGGVSITNYLGTEKSVIIPEKISGFPVVNLTPGAFDETEILGIHLPNSMTEINEEALSYYGTLLEVILGENTKTIGYNAFGGCSALRNVKLNANLETIGEMAFNLCSSLEKIEFNKSLKAINTGAFVMSGLKELNIPSNVEMIGEKPFGTCKNLEKVFIAEGVKKIEEEAFQHCVSLKEVHIPGSVTEIGSRIVSQSEDAVIYAPKGSYAETYAVEHDIPFVAE